MDSNLLGAAVQLSLLLSEPSAALSPSADGRHCVGINASCLAEARLLRSADSAGQFGDGTAILPRWAGLPRSERLRQSLFSTSLRLAANHTAASQYLQAEFTFHTLRYAFAMHHYFRVRHLRQDCALQVAAWTKALDAAQKANINTDLRDIPQDCPLR